MALSSYTVNHSPELKQFFIEFDDGSTFFDLEIAQGAEIQRSLISLVLARALLDYQEESPKVYEFYHTETPVHMRGKGIASIVSTVRKMHFKFYRASQPSFTDFYFKSAMEWIKSNNYKAHLTCSYLKGDFLAKNPQWIDWVKID